MLRVQVRVRDRASVIIGGKVSLSRLDYEV